MPETAKASREQLLVRAQDQHHWRVQIFDGGSPAAVVVILAAMGVRGSFYRPFAAELMKRGYAAVTSDLRGHGESSLRPSRSVDFGYRELCELDVPALIAAVRARYPTLPIALLGHSLGGQVATLYAAANPDAIDGLALVCSGSPHAKNFTGVLRGVAWSLGKLAPGLGRALGYYPGQLVRFGGREARGVMVDWAQAVSTGLFRPRDSGIDYEAKLRQCPVPTLAISFEDDKWCPPAAVTDLVRRLHSAEVEQRHLERSDTDGETYDHFRWAREPAPAIRALSPWLAALQGMEQARQQSPESATSGRPNRLK